MSKYSEDALNLYGSIVDKDNFGLLTPEGFELRKQFVIDNQEWIQKSPDHQKMPVMVSPDLLPLIDDPLPSTLEIALIVKPSIVWQPAFFEYDWQSMSDDQILRCINHSTVLSRFFASDDFDRYDRLSHRNDFNPNTLNTNYTRQHSPAMSFPVYCVYNRFKHHTNLQCNDVKQHPLAIKQSVVTHTNKHGQKPFPVNTLLPTINTPTTLHELMTLCRVDVQSYTRGSKISMDNADNKFAVFSIHKDHLKGVIEPDIVDKLIDILQYKNFMACHPDMLVVGWVRYSRRDGLTWIDEVQSRMRADGLYKESQIPATEWKNIDEHLLSMFIMLTYESYGYHTVWLPSIKMMQTLSDDQLSETYHKFPKRVGFSKEIVDNVGTNVDGMKGWRLILDQSIL